MAPRQRLSPQPSVEEMNAANESSSSDPSPPSSLSRPLIPKAAHQTASGNSASGRSSKDQAAADHAAMSDIAREHHDIFNLVALLFVIAATAVDWNLYLLLQGYGVEEAFNGDYFWWTWGTSVAYFLTDLTWVSLVPHCVKSPGTIVKHHCVVVVYLLGPIFFPKWRFFMGACLTVEINTWFLILRRVVYKRKIDLLSDLVSACFYVSWIIIRCFIYPGIMVTFVRLWIQTYEETNKVWHPELIFFPVHFVLCVLNLKWSYDLFMPIIKSWLSKDEKAPGVANGL